MVKFWVFVFISSFIIITGCSDKVDVTAEEDTTLATYASIKSTIIDVSCAISGCHSGSLPAAGLALDGEGPLNNLVNRTSQGDGSLNLITPGDSANSYLVHKLEGTALSGRQMPGNAAPLDTKKITAVKNWIDAGAFMPTLASIQSNIFNKERCTSCHSATSTNGGLDLVDIARNGLVDMPANIDNTEILVKINDAEGSFLIKKLEGRLESGQGIRMRADGLFLDQATIDVIRSWIDAGAQ